ncbi:TetR/AcrR family transcriptional regulator [Leptospira ilyithenensis]|uniref:TetR/AcrR family transcriptional regulator n=1 Tax=Leptospira ilyithenensis TaxID=2484901 RepID=A0A4R9LWG8_9LEPT|nr:TetR/AcrR family transcriptional regulator [Leptospira ilyithenensis]TGN14401.1 TetR/AcrR family transcriptional regulator [Leptospira ilyithenensis]
MAKKIKHKTGRPKGTGRVLDRESVLDTAWHLANRDGIENLSIKRIANELEIRSPSLYNHIKDLLDITSEVAARTANQFAENLETIMATTKPEKNRKEGLRKFILEYRNFAHNHKGVYPLLVSAPSGNENHRLASDRILKVCLTALSLKVLDARAIHQIRILRAVLHGFISLERENGFGLPESVEESFQILMKGLVEGKLLRFY